MSNFKWIDTTPVDKPFDYSLSDVSSPPNPYDSYWAPKFPSKEFFLWAVHNVANMMCDEIPTPANQPKPISETATHFVTSGSDATVTTALVPVPVLVEHNAPFDM